MLSGNVVSKSRAGASNGFRLRASALSKVISLEKVGDGIEPDKRFVKVFTLETIGRFDWRWKTVDCKL